MFSYLKAESVRQHPEATVRPWAICHIVEDGLSFASALGYKYVYIYSVKLPPAKLYSIFVFLSMAYMPHMHCEGKEARYTRGVMRFGVDNL